jgi:pimeloyl-ACP methyl ester carboxylesterase
VRLVEANHIRLHVGEIAPNVPADGEPRTAVLVHGLAGDSMASWYLTLAGPLAENGLRVLLYDLRGHGRSDRPSRGYAFDDFVDDLGALLEQWDVHGRLYLVGNSFGGTIAFGLAARHPDRIDGIATIESPPPVATWFRRVAARFAHAREPDPLSRPDFDGNRQLIELQRFLTETAAGDELPASRLPDPAAYAAVTCPVLSLYGDSSRVLDLAEETTRLLPQAHVVVLPGGDHWLLIKQRQLVTAHILRWLGCPALLPAGVTGGSA